MTRAFLLLAYCILFAGCAIGQPPVLHKLSVNHGPKLSGPLRAQSAAPYPKGLARSNPRYIDRCLV